MTTSFFFSGAPISCVSSLQSLTALSTIESELVAITPCMKEACHIQDLLRELKFNVRENQHRKRLDWGNFRRFHKWILSKDQAPTTTQVVLQGSHRAWTDQRQFPSFPQMDTQQGPSTSNYASGSARISSSVDESAFIMCPRKYYLRTSSRRHERSTPETCGLDSSVCKLKIQTRTLSCHSVKDHA